MVEVGDSVLIENNNEMIPGKVEHVSLFTEIGNNTINIFLYRSKD